LELVLQLTDIEFNLHVQLVDLQLQLIYLFNISFVQQKRKERKRRNTIKPQ